MPGCSRNIDSASYPWISALVELELKTKSDHLHCFCPTIYILKCLSIIIWNGRTDTILQLVLRINPIHYFFPSTHELSFMMNNNFKNPAQTMFYIWQVWWFNGPGKDQTLYIITFVDLKQGNFILSKLYIHNVFRL